MHKKRAGPGLYVFIVLVSILAFMILSLHTRVRAVTRCAIRAFRDTRDHTMFEENCAATRHIVCFFCNCISVAKNIGFLDIKLRNS